MRMREGQKVRRNKNLAGRTGAVAEETRTIIIIIIITYTALFP